MRNFNGGGRVLPFQIFSEGNCPPRLPIDVFTKYVSVCARENNIFCNFLHENRSDPDLI